MAFIIPFVNYDAHMEWFYPGNRPPEVRANISKAVERVDLDTGGTTPQRHSVLIGDRNYIDVEWRWMSGSKRAEFFTFWDAVKDGSEFEFGEDSTVPKCNDGSECGDGTTCGLRTSGVTQTRYIVVMDSTDPGMYPDEIWGYYGCSFRLRVIEGLND